MDSLVGVLRNWMTGWFHHEFVESKPFSEYSYPIASWFVFCNSQRAPVLNPFYHHNLDILLLICNHHSHSNPPFVRYWSINILFNHVSQQFVANTSTRWLNWFSSQSFFAFHLYKVLRNHNRALLYSQVGASLSLRPVSKISLKLLTQREHE